MPRFLHLADIHLGARFSYLDPEKQETRKRDLLDAFSRAIGYACSKANKIDAVWLPGDLFDSQNPSKQLTDAVDEEFKRLNDAGIECLLTPGTHDSSICPGSIYRRHKFPGVTLLNDPNPDNPVKRTYHGTDFYFYGMEYHPIKSRKPFGGFRAVNKEGKHVALLHGTLLVEGHWKASDIYLPLEPSDLAGTGMDYIALGHYHNFSQHKCGDIPAVYPGTLEGRKFNESGERFLVIVNFLPDRQIFLEKIPWNRMVYTSADINVSEEGIESDRDLVEAIKTYAIEGKKGILRVRLSGCREFPIDMESLRKSVEKEFFFVHIEDDTTFLNSSLMKSYLQEKSVRGLFIRILTERMENSGGREREVYNFALKAALEKMQGEEAVEI